MLFLIKVMIVFLAQLCNRFLNILDKIIPVLVSNNFQLVTRMWTVNVEALKHQFT